MAEPKAIIRAYKTGDEKFVKFTLGLAAMEGLAIANRRGKLKFPRLEEKARLIVVSAAFHPLTLSLWVGLSCVMIQLLDWWPKPEYHLLGHLSPLPAFACWGVPILFAIDWYIPTLD